MGKDKIIGFNPIVLSFDHNLKETTHIINSILVDNFDRSIKIVVQEKNTINHIIITFEEAVNIGFLNPQKIESYIK